MQLQDVLQKSISNFEGQHPIYSINENHQIYTNIDESNFDNYQFFN